MWFLIPSVPTGGEERRSKEAEPLPRCIEAQVYVLASHFIVGPAGPLCMYGSVLGRVDAVVRTGSQAASQS